MFDHPSTGRPRYRSQGRARRLSRPGRARERSGSSPHELAHYFASRGPIRRSDTGFVGFSFSRPRLESRRGPARFNGMRTIPRFMRRSAPSEVSGSCGTALPRPPAGLGTRSSTSTSSGHARGTTAPSARASVRRGATRSAPGLARKAWRERLTEVHREGHGLRGLRDRNDPSDVESEITALRGAG